MILIAIVTWMLVLGGGGALLTRLGPWYYGLTKPSWQPPDWLFGPAWTTIFLAAGGGWWLAWRAGAEQPAARQAVVVAYVINGLLNLLWSYLFFWRRRPDWAQAEVGFLWVSIAAIVVVNWRLDPWAGALVLPYLFWVAFASWLNRAIVRLNGPFA